jgi:hypothetical protein
MCFFRASLSSNGDGTDHIVAFLEGLGGGNEKIDNLRLPLQVALLISPIFLLQDVQMHLSSFYAQRHKIVLVCIYINLVLSKNL